MSISFIDNELPSNYADRLGLYYSTLVDKDHKKNNGQFFTPREVAIHMGEMSEFTGKTVNILDPGCGIGILSCSLIEYLVKNTPISKIDLTLYETDSLILPYTELCITYLSKWLENQNVKFTYTIEGNDFILSNYMYLSADSNLFNNTKFDIIVSNPPYFKLSIDDPRTTAAKIIINGQPNIYSIFMAIAAKLLRIGGHLIFITPRSYASGGYFKRFREFFFNIVDIEKIHLFVSRKDAFNRDKVLQETVIICGKRVNKNNPNNAVNITSSNGISDLINFTTKTFRQDVLIDMESSEKVLYIPSSNLEETILNTIKSWDGTLGKYNIQISTGPVVSFRALDFIMNSFDESCSLAPLFWLQNVKQMILEWPLLKFDKGQYIKIQPESKSILIPNKNYILLRRFSTKDDKSRLIAAPYFSNFLKSEFIGVENKLNYIYRKGGQLLRNEVVGLSAILNSQLFNNYFQIFNGNVNVSATELREMKFPALHEIKWFGDEIIKNNNYSIEYINSVINEYYKL